MSQEPNKASAPKADNAGVYHLQLKQGDVPGYVILPGSPERTLKIAQNWSDVEEVAFYREYKTVRGNYKGVPLAATSTGIGAPVARSQSTNSTHSACTLASGWAPPDRSWRTSISAI